MKPEEHHESTDREDDDAGRQADDGDGRVEHRVHEPRRRDEQEARQADRQEADDIPGQALLRRQGPDLALDADPLADGVGDRVQDLGEVAADLVLDRDRGRHELEVVRPYAADHVLEGLLERQAEVHLADDPPELGGDRRSGLTDDELDGLQERRSGAQRVGDERDRVRERLVERVEASRLAPSQPELGEHEPDEAADQHEERVAERREARPTARASRSGMPIVDASPDHEELGRLELEVCARDLARQVGTVVAPLDRLVEVGERGALGDQVGDRPLAASWTRPWSRSCSTHSVPAGPRCRSSRSSRRRRRSAGWPTRRHRPRRG